MQRAACVGVEGQLELPVVKKEAQSYFYGSDGKRRNVQRGTKASIVVPLVPQRWSELLETGVLIEGVANLEERVALKLLVWFLDSQSQFFGHRLTPRRGGRQRAGRNSPNPASLRIACSVLLRELYSSVV